MYQSTDTSSILRMQDGALIPRDEANFDYAAYLEWVAKGNEPLPYVAPPTPVPPSVSPRQIRQALNRVPYGPGTLRDAVEAAVAAGDQDTKDWWEFATEFQRDNPEVLAMGQALGVPAADLDALWMLAGSL